MKDFKPMTYKELEKCVFQDPENWDEKLVETAGFVPLEVRMRQMEQAGYVAQFQASDFTSSDMRAIWLNPDFEILPGDDLEEVERKTQLREQFRQELLAKKNPPPTAEEALTDEKEQSNSKIKETSQDVQENG